MVGVAHGDDPLFAEYKTIIGAFHWDAARGDSARAGRYTEAAHPGVETVRVIAYALPIIAETRRSNRRQHKLPSKRWAQTRHYGEIFNNALRDHLVGLLRKSGYLAIAPAHPSWVKVYKEEGARPPAATWSERHALYAAGLGTFSLSDGFITPRGIAMRCGSVVTNLPLDPDPRDYTNHLANCLFFADGSCRACIARCPAGAISAHGHDKARCGAYLDEQLGSLKETYQVSITGCGLCQTAVPCEAGIPRRRKR